MITYYYNVLLRTYINCGNLREIASNKFM